MNAVGAIALGGAVTPGGAVGKLTSTRFPGVVLLLSYPLKFAYWQTGYAAVEVEEQLNAVPVVNP
jgi:hypothetical protein